MGNDELDLSQLKMKANAQLYDRNVVIPYLEGYLIQLGYKRFLQLNEKGEVIKDIKFEVNS